MWMAITWTCLQLKGSVKDPNKFHNYETEKITRKASDAAEYIEMFGSFTEPFDYNYIDFNYNYV